jgi:hypothetical protein
MMTLEINTVEQHNRFIKRVIEAGEVWALTTNGDWVFADSNEDEEKDTAIFPVWSDKTYAKRCATKEWAPYIPDSIPLAEFLESWCAGLHNNQELIGTNWDSELRGLEIKPLQLVLQMLDALKTTKKILPLKLYATMQEVEEQVRQSI